MTNPTQQLTEAEAVEIVARRMGYHNLYQSLRGEWYGTEPGEVEPFTRSSLPDYPNSRDALQPVLETMTAEEWDRFDEIMCEKFSWEAVNLLTQFILTLPARTLCLAVAAAIKESAK